MFDTDINFNLSSLLAFFVVWGLCPRPPFDIKNLKVLNLQCRSMNNKRIFTDLAHRQSVHLCMKNWVQNSTSSSAMFIHHFGKTGRNDVRPIVAKFPYHQQLKIVLGMSINYGVAPLVFMNNFPTKQLKDVISRNEETIKRTTMVHDR